MFLLCCFASIIVLYLIRDMKLYNGHIFLVICMSIGQLLYDFSFPLTAIDYGSNTMYVFFNLFQIAGGLSVAIASNIMTFVVLYVIKTNHYIHILSYTTFVYFLISVPSILLCIFYLLGSIISSDIVELEQTIYIWLRLISIAFNFIICSLGYVYTRHLTARMNATVAPSLQASAVCTLINRMQWYPIIQAISRSGLAWYECKSLAFDFKMCSFHMTSLLSLSKSLSLSHSSPHTHKHTHTTSHS